MRGKIRQLLLWRLIAASLIAAGCATPARDGARLLAAYTTSVQQRGQEFATQRNELARQRLRSVDDLETHAFELEGKNAQNLMVQKVAKDNDRVALLTSVREAADAEATHRREAAENIARRATEIEALAPAVQIRTEQLSATSKTLGELAESPTVWQETKFLVGFVQEVTKVSKDDQESAEKKAAEATKDSVNRLTMEAADGRKAEEAK